MKKYSDEEVHIAVTAAKYNMKRYEDICNDYKEWEQTCAKEYAEWCVMELDNYLKNLGE